DRSSIYPCGVTILRCSKISEQSLWFQLWKQDHIADAFLAEEHHAEAVDANANTAGGWHAVFEGDEEIFVELLLFAARLMFEPLALFDRIILFGVAGRDFLAVDAELEHFDRGRVVRRELGQRHQ